jgi:hypothetical protein
MSHVDLDKANHTGRELELMLAGAKPLAWFTFCVDYEHDRYLEHQAEFAPFVQSGQLIEEIYDEVWAFDPRIGRHLTTGTVLYALAGEEWRIPAMRLILSVNAARSDSGPNEVVDRVIGRLLGYAEQEVEAYLAAGNYGGAATAMPNPSSQGTREKPRSPGLKR